MAETMTVINYFCLEADINCMRNVQRARDDVLASRFRPAVLRSAFEGRLG